jgi:PAS domain S-box-containing protein
MVDPAVDAPVAIGPQILFGFDPEGVCTMSVGAGLAAVGFSSGQLVGQNLLDVFADEPASLAAVRRALAGETFVSEDLFHGRLVWTYYQALRDDSGALTGSIGVTTDMTRQHEAESAVRLARERAKRLADLAVSLSREVLDIEGLLALAVRSAVEMLGDLGAIWLLDPLREVLAPRAVWHGDPAAHELMLKMAADASSQTRWLDLDTIEALGGPAVFDRAQIEEQGLLQGEGYAEAAECLGLHSLIRLPLHSRGRVVGLIDVARGAGHGAYDEDDTVLALDIAERCALALDNALLLRAERDAREHLVQFKALADASLDLIAIADNEGALLYLNPRVDQLGLRTSGLDLWQAAEKYLGAEALQRIQAGLESDSRWSGDLNLLGGSEAILTVDAFQLEHPESGDRLGTAWIARDVTRLRATEQALRAANAELKQFQALVAASTDFIAIGALDGKVLYINPAGRELIGLDPSVDVQTTTIADYIPEPALESSRLVEREAVISQGHWEGESLLTNLRDGRPIPVAVASFLISDLETGLPFALATVRRDITDRIATDAALRDLAEQRQALLTRLVDAQEAERSQIADGIHDDSVQALAAVGLRLGLLRRRLTEQAPQLLGTLELVQDSVSGATDRLRALLFDLEPPALGLGLAHALRNAAADIFTGTDVVVVVEGDTEPDLPDSTLVIAFRIAREAMINARKHAAARTVAITVAGLDSRLLVTIADDGVGVGPAPVRSSPGHRGLSSMRDRAAVARGEWEIQPGANGGTVVSFWLPASS